MADYNANIAPFLNVTFYVTSVFGEQPRNHKGLDIATPNGLGNVPLYSMCNGQVILKHFDSTGYGNYMIIKDSITGKGFLYGHMFQPTMLNVGDNVVIGQLVGYEGTTGHSTGIHLHLEMQDLSNRNWQFGAPLSTYLNPADFMGIPNRQGISCYYDGNPINPPDPPTPGTERNKKGFNFILFNRRRKYLNGRKRRI